MGSSGERAAVSEFPLPRPGSSRSRAEERERELVAVARALGIPWERLIEAEIEAERKLRRFLGEPAPELPLWRHLSALPATALDSWRVRERLAALLREARVARSAAAMRSIREAIEELCGKGPGVAAEDEPLAVHLRQAHERVRELARVARAAERCRGESAGRLALVVARTGCTRADAGWAVARAQAPGRAHAIDDAVRKAREEGFEIPVAESEFHSFLALRKLLRRNPPRARRRGRSAARRVNPGARRDHRLAS